jgi:putative transposase
MAYVRIWVHAVWGTKNRYPFLQNGIKQKIIEHIKSNARKKEIFIDSIDGHSDHLHALIGLNADMSIATVMNLIKGESSFWINKEKLTTPKFEWAAEYYAASVSDSILPIVRNYIRNQEEHHRKKSFEEECKEVFQEFGL